MKWWADNVRDIYQDATISLRIQNILVCKVSFRGMKYVYFGFSPQRNQISMCRINVFLSFVGAWIVQALVTSVILLSTIRPSDFFYVFTTFSAIAFKGFVVDFGRRWTIAIKLSNFQWFLVYESSLVFVRRSHFPICIQGTSSGGTSNNY